jgi:hypothetical protein
VTENTSSPTLTKREAFIASRTYELLNAGWNRLAAKKRAARDWRLQSPQHKAAVARNNAMHASRLARYAELPTTDAARLAIEVRP